MAIESWFKLLKNLFIFSSYVVEKSSFPMPLTKEKEKYYLDRAEKGDEEAKEILIKHNLRLVVHVAKKYANFGDNDELISVGSIGLIKAVSTYRQGKGTGLATYASRCIENEILMTLRSSKKHRNNLSLHEPIGIDKDGNELSVIDMIADDKDVIEEVERDILMERLCAITKDCLDRREYEIIKYRYGLEGNVALTQREIAQMFNISRSYISRIEKKALEKIRGHVSKEDLI